jgi:TrmH family RNA methyltransferase
MELLTSKENAAIKRVARLLSSRRFRDTEGSFVCEGARLILDGIESGHTPEALYTTQRAFERYPALQEAAKASDKAYLITEALAEKIAETSSPQGVFAVFKKLDNGKTPATIKSGDGKRSYVLLSQVQDPGNVGAILRTCEAFGVTEVLLSADCADPYSPKVLRAGMGAVFRQPLRLCANLLTEMETLRESGVHLFAAALGEDSRRLGEIAFPPAAGVLIGNEGNGLPEELIAACDDCLLIPMPGGAESLNAAVAAGILVWEITKPTI